MIKYFSILLFCGCFLFSSDIFTFDQIAYSQEKSNLPTFQDANSVVLWAQNNLSQNGVLKEGKDGYIYLKVDDDYINQLFPMLSNSAYAKPPYFRRPDSPGAHISVFYVDERNQTGKIEEIGNEYSFKISRLTTVPPKTRQYIILEVSSPELEQLREKYGLSPLLKEHEFHITIAKKKERHH